MKNKKIKKQDKLSNKSRIPEFKNRQEEAEWFDTHDIADFQDEFVIIQRPVKPLLSTGFNVRFDEDTVKMLREEAQKKSIGPTTLIRIWVKEKLNQSSKSN